MAPPSKKRKKSSAVEEVTFDFDARSEYLTGFHKRKVQRIKQAQEQAAKQDRIDKLENRKRIRDERKEEVEKHVETVNALLREAANGSGAESSEDEGDAANGDMDAEWNGIEDTPALVQPILDHEDEYVDEDRYTTVTVETVDVSKDGLTKVAGTDEEDGDENAKVKKIDRRNEGKKAWTKERPKKPKVKKKKFRYESKVERKVTRGKERSKNKAQAKARRE